MSYVYVQTEWRPAVYTVGHYNPKGEWQSDSDHIDREKAAQRCHYLNGGRDTQDLLDALRQLRDALQALGGKLQ